MSDNTTAQFDDDAVIMGNGTTSTISAIGSISEAGVWFVSQLDEMVASGDTQVNRCWLMKR